MAITPFSAALKQVAVERGISEESVLESIEVALATAYRRDYGGELEELTVDLDSSTGEAKILQEGEDVTPPGFGRIAAQTAKQVILQKIRETEKEVIFDEFKSRIGEIVTGTIFRVDNGLVTLDLGKAHGILPQMEQVDVDHYESGQRLKVLVKDIREGSRGTEIIVSRSDAQFLAKLFEQEVPEIASGTVIIEALAREAGARSKMAVSTIDDRIDPVGSCVGQKGVRVQSIISEIHGEKIDIVPFDEDISKFIASSLSPARVTGVEIDEETKEAKVSVPEDQLSLAIGKAGQNVRLAAKLTKWRIDIKGAVGIFDEASGEIIDPEKTGQAVVGIWDAAIKAANEALEEEKVEKKEEKAEEAEEVKETEEEKTEEPEEETKSEDVVEEEEVSEKKKKKTKKKEKKKKKEDTAVETKEETSEAQE